MTLERLERGLAIAALIVHLHGETYVPLFERMEREVAKAKATQAARRRALRTLRRLGPKYLPGVTIP